MSPEPSSHDDRSSLRNLLLQVPAAPACRSYAQNAGKVVIIMRTKDRPLLLHRAVRSATGQMFGNWHLYLVNDGGDPACVEAIVDAHLTALAGRVTILHNATSLGMEAASNRALATAEGDFFAVHDDDDSWDPHFLARTVAFLDQPAHADMVGVVTGCTKLYERIEGDRVIAEEQSPEPEAPNVADLEKLLVINRALPISLLFRMSLIERLGGFNPDLPVVGDWEFNIRALLLGDIGVIAEPLAFYHLRRQPPDAAYGNSIIAGKSEHAKYDRLLRNSVLRRAVERTPDLLGVLQPVLHAVHAAREVNRQQVNQAVNALAEHQKRTTAFLLGEMRGLLAQHESNVTARVIAGLRNAIDTNSSGPLAANPHANFR